MTSILRNVTFLNSGYCRQLAYFAGRKSLRSEKFYAVFVYLEHPTEGPCVIDTGYSEAFWSASRFPPQRLHRWATPTILPKQGSAAGVLMSQGIDPASIGRVFVSHFHADHIGGLQSFEDTRFVYRKEPLDRLKRMSSVMQVHHGFLSRLLPDNFETLGESVASDVFRGDASDLDGLLTYDYFGDQSLLLVDLPGHALGHTGYLMQTAEGPLFYIVDSCWDIDVMHSRKKLPWLSRFIQHDIKAYESTQHKLLSLDAAPTMLACHCPRTQQHVATS